MLKQLLTGSALALLMAATPVAAQTDNATQAEPQAEATTPSTGGTAGTTTGGTAGATTDSAQTGGTTTDSSAATADSAESDTAQSGEAMETDAAASDEAMQETESETATETTAPATDNSDEAAAELENEMETSTETATTTETTDAAGGQQASGELYIGEQMEDELLANSLIGTNVENPEGENLGSISDVIVTENEGIKAVVIGVGGFLGIGQKDVAVNYDQIEQTRDENGDLQLVLTTTKDDLENAPEFVSLEEKEEAARQQAEAPADAGGTMGSGTMGGGAAGTGATAPAGGATAPAGGTTQ